MSSHELPSSSYIVDWDEFTSLSGRKELLDRQHIPWHRYIEAKYRELEERVGRRRVPREAPWGCRYGSYRQERAIRRGGSIELKVQLKLVMTRTYWGNFAGVVE